MLAAVVALRIMGQPLLLSPVGGEEDRGELGRAEQISAGKVCPNWASEQRNLPRDVSNFIAAFFFLQGLPPQLFTLTAVPKGALCVCLSKILILSEWH